MYELMNDQGELQYVKLLEDSGELKAGTAIHNQSRFWAAYQEWLAEGNTPRPCKPEGFYEWDGEVWVEDESKVAAQEIAKLEASITPRNLRSAALGDQYAIDLIQGVEDQIAALREKL